MGYISPGGKSSLIVYRNGMWYIDTNRDGVTDSVVAFGGVPGDIPLTANFSGPGQLDDIVIYRAGAWYVDTDLSGSANLTYMFGACRATCRWRAMSTVTASPIWRSTATASGTSTRTATARPT